LDKGGPVVKFGKQKKEAIFGSRISIFLYKLFLALEVW